VTFFSPVNEALNMPVLGRIFYCCVGNSGSRRVSKCKVVPVEVLKFLNFSPPRECWKYVL
jgi:hypothetical protein